MNTDDSTCRHWTCEQAAIAAQNATYQALVVFEDLEHADKIIGNGHHMRQQIRDGWYVSIHATNPWWRPAGRSQLRYAVVAKKGEYHVELGGNSLTELRRAVRMLKGVPRDDLPFTREWWQEEGR